MLMLPLKRFTESTSPALKTLPGAAPRSMLGLTACPDAATVAMNESMIASRFIDLFLRLHDEVGERERIDGNEHVVLFQLPRRLLVLFCLLESLEGSD